MILRTPRAQGSFLTWSVYILNQTEGFFITLKIKNLLITFIDKVIFPRRCRWSLGTDVIYILLAYMYFKKISLKALWYVSALEDCRLDTTKIYVTFVVWFWIMLALVRIVMCIIRIVFSSKTRDIYNISKSFEWFGFDFDGARVGQSSYVLQFWCRVVSHVLKLTHSLVSWVGGLISRICYFQVVNHPDEYQLYLVTDDEG